MWRLIATGLGLALALGAAAPASAQDQAVSFNLGYLRLAGRGFARRR